MKRKKVTHKERNAVELPEMSGGYDYGQAQSSGGFPARFGAAARRFFRRKREDVLVSVVVGLLILAVGAVIGYAIHSTEPASRFSDAALRDWTLQQITAGGQLRIQDLKVLHPRLTGYGRTPIVAFADVYGRGESAEMGRGVLYVFDKVGPDYHLSLKVAPVVEGDGPVPFCCDLIPKDLNGDGNDELTVLWYEGTVSGFEKYAAVISWDGKYEFVGTVPTFDCPQASGTMIPPAGQSARMSFEVPGERPHIITLHNATHVDLKDVNGDGRPELVCSHMIWRMSPVVNGAVSESRGSDHSYVVRALEVTSNKMIVPFYQWNDGEPLYVAEKQPAFSFVLTNEIISMGRKSAK